MKISLKAARINKDMTQQEMATALGVTKKTVGSWENGKTMPGADKIDPICDLLGVRYDDILWKPNFFCHR